DGALRVGDGPNGVTVWKVPHDPFLPALERVLGRHPGIQNPLPFLPALERVLDPGVAAQLVAGLDGDLGSPTTRLRAYRPGRRAVVEAQGEGGHRVYLKLVKPKRLEGLRRRHDELSQHVPVPQPLGAHPELGLLVMPTMRGRTLREVLEDPGATLPDPE